MRELSRLFFSFAGLYAVRAKKTAHQTHGVRQMLTDFDNSFTDRFCNKFAVKRLLCVPPHIAYGATLPCETLMRVPIMTQNTPTDEASRKDVPLGGYKTII